MKKLMTLFAALAIAAVLSACNMGDFQMSEEAQAKAVQVVDTALVTANAGLALQTLDTDYAELKRLLDYRKDIFTTDELAKLQSLQVDADAFAHNVRELWENDKLDVVAQANRLYELGEVIYKQGHEIVAPKIDQFSLLEQYELRKFAEAASDVSAVAKKLQEDPSLQNKVALVQAGVGFAKMAVKVGVMLSDK